jgi:hypothetical protein
MRWFFRWLTTPPPGTAPLDRAALIEAIKLPCC